MTLVHDEENDEDESTTRLHKSRYQSISGFSSDSPTQQASDKSDPVSLDTALAMSTMPAAKEAGHAREATEGDDSWQ
jgi:hypothetical protein